MELPGRNIDALSYSRLIETLVGLTLKLEVVRQALDPDDDTSAELITQISNDAVRAAALAQVDPKEWARINDQIISALTVKSN
jgi:hypothetical protein